MKKFAVLSFAATFLLFCFVVPRINIIEKPANADFPQFGKLALEPLEACGCLRSVIKDDYWTEIDPKSDVFKEATCSKEVARVRGAHQKVIAFTFYSGGTFDSYQRDYFEGIKINLDLIQKLYGPDWTMRLYYQIPDNSTMMSKLCNIACQNSQLDICNIEQNPKFGNISAMYPLIWRFLPSLDPQVDVFLVRDLDSQISPREVDAVNEFLFSGREFHGMRDHPQHDVPILGGLWGMKLTPDMRSQMKSSFDSMLAKSSHLFGKRTEAQHDQTVLTRYIWPWAQSVALFHDSYFCKKYGFSKAFPTQRPEGLGNFVGSVISLGNSIPSTKKYECPQECRPKYHKDWMYC